MSNPSYIGVSSSQDGRFRNKEEIYKRETKFAKIFEQKVDIKKVNTKFCRQWIDNKSKLIFLLTNLFIYYSSRYIGRQR